MFQMSSSVRILGWLKADASGDAESAPDCVGSGMAALDFAHVGTDFFDVAADLHDVSRESPTMSLLYLVEMSIPRFCRNVDCAASTKRANSSGRARSSGVKSRARSCSVRRSSLSIACRIASGVKRSALSSSASCGLSSSAWMMSSMAIGGMFVVLPVNCLVEFSLEWHYHSTRLESISSRSPSQPVPRSERASSTDIGSTDFYVAARVRSAKLIASRLVASW